MRRPVLMRIFAVFSLICMLLPCNIVFAEPDNRISAEDIYSCAVKSVQFIKKENNAENNSLFNSDFLKKADDDVSVSILCSFSALGISDNYAEYTAILTDDIAKQPNASNDLTLMSLGLMAMGENPSKIDIGLSEPFDALKKGVWAREKSRSLAKEGVLGISEALIVLDGQKTVLPDSKDEITNTRESLIMDIMAQQKEDGSFYQADMASPRVTARVLTALAPYKNYETVYSYTSLYDSQKRENTVGSVILKALEYLSSQRSQTGVYSNYGVNNLVITSSVVTMMSSLGLDFSKDERFLKDDVTMIENLLKYQNEDGSFGEKDLYTDTVYALEALSAYYRYAKDERGFFDFTDRVKGESTPTLLMPDLTNAVAYYNRANSLVSTDSYEELVILISRAKKSVASGKNSVNIGILENVLERLYEKKNSIKILNEECKKLSEYGTTFGTKNTHAAKNLVAEYNALTEKDKAKIENYEDFLSKKNSLGSRSLVVYVFIGFICLIAIAFVLFIAVFFLRSSPFMDYFLMRITKGKHGGMKEQPYANYEDYEDDPLSPFAPDDTEYMDMDYEAPLPYENDEEFFEYVSEDEIENIENNEEDEGEDDPAFFW